MFNRDELLTQFNRFLINQKEIRLLNLYKGIPIIYPGRIIEVNPVSVTVQVEKHQIVSMQQEGFTVIQGEYLRESIRARVYRVRYRSMQALLTNFEVAHSNIAERMVVRVELEDPITGTIQSGNVTAPLRGQLVDISLEGFAIFIDRDDYSAGAYREGSEVTVSVKFSNVNIPTDSRIRVSPQISDDPMTRFSRDSLRLTTFPDMINRNLVIKKQTSPLKQTYSPDLVLTGVIANVRRMMASDRFRIGIKISPVSSSKVILHQIISQRQSEIIREIRDLYEEELKKELNT